MKLTLLMLIAQAFAAGQPPRRPFVCEELMHNPLGPIEFHSSGRNEELERQLHEDTILITQVANDLGLKTPAHQVNFVPADQLNVMASMGGQPLPHYVAGHKLATSMGRVMGVLEFVTPGCPTCRSYYSDQTTLAHQRSVLMHVMGHNDYSVNSRVIADRQADPPAAGIQLAHMISQLYDSQDHDEVSQFVQSLYSLSYLQDFTYATWEAPSKFDPKLTPSMQKDKPVWSYTPNPLQALTHQLPADAAFWKAPVLSLFEQIERIYPAYASTKIPNEGWATMQEYLIAKYLPWNTTKDVVEYATLGAAVAYPSLSNPYWLGLMGWDLQYKRFLKRPEIARLDEKHQDRAFIQFAQETYAPMTQYEWLQFVIDDDFCSKFRLYLYRNTLREEFLPGIPQDKQKFITLSGNSVRIRQYLARKMGDYSLQLSRIMLHNPALKDSSRLDLSHEVAHGIPLEIASAFKTMFVIAQTFQKRVRLNLGLNPMEYLDVRARVKKYYMDLYARYDVQIDHIIRWVDQMSKQQALQIALQAGLISHEEMTQLAPAILEVDPDGHVKASLVTNPDGKAQMQDEETLANLGLQQIRAYKEDLLMSMSQEMQEAQRRRWDRLTMQVTDHVTNPSMDIVQYAPYAGMALHELIQMMESRFQRAFRAALNAGKISPTKNGVSLKVLPEIPTFNLDMRYANMLKRMKPVGPVENPHEINTQPAWGMDDNDSRIGSGERLPGDRFAGNPSGKGQGDGDGDGDEGDDGDDGEQPGDVGDGQPNGPGDGSGNPSDIEIPLSLYGSLLAEELDLPNIRRTNGQSEDTLTRPYGAVHKPAGTLLWDKIAEEALNIARAIRAQKGLPYTGSVSPVQLIKEGMKYIDSTDYIVEGTKDYPRPDFDAVLVVNVDVTGSMAGERIKIAKNLVFNMKALLSAKYKNVKIHYVGFDSTAEEVPESKIWTYFKGGGTAYTPPLVEDQKILAQYPNSKWNKYVLTIGDGETGDGAAMVQELGNFKHDLQYFGLAITSESGAMGAADLLQHVEAYKSTWPWIGNTVLKSQADIPKGLQELFPKGGKVVSGQ